jgi:hypothetical protein
MSINKKYEELIKKYLVDDISKKEKSELLALAKSNKEIADLLGLHKLLDSPEINFKMADAALFKETRLKTLNKIRVANSKAKPSIHWVKDFLAGLLRKPAFTAIFAAAMFLFGFLLNNPSEEFQLIKSIHNTAAQTEDLQSSINTPYIYQNATFKEQPDGKVSVSFNVIRHIQISRSKNDPLVQEILAQSLINSNSVPERLRSISNTNISMHPKIKQALITTMLNDSHPIVRQKSLFSLMEYKNDKDIQDALIKLLSSEESVYMRLAAIDYLSNNDVDLSLVEENINTLDNSNNSAVNQKIKQLKFKPNEVKQ